LAEHEVRSLSDQVDAAVSHAIDKVVPELAGADPVIRPSERADFQANAVLGFGAAVTEVGDLLEPHRLCGYLYDLAKAFSTFYQQCPVVTEEEPLRGNRTALCQLAAETLHKGLDLLGTAAPKRM
jgi:arginyl-tRNA synthetase